MTSKKFSWYKLGTLILSSLVVITFLIWGLKLSKQIYIQQESWTPIAWKNETIFMMDLRQNGDNNLSIDNFFLISNHDNSLGRMFFENKKLNNSFVRTLILQEIPTIEGKDCREKTEPKYIQCGNLGCPNFTVKTVCSKCRDVQTKEIVKCP